jgi:hypothetical protein
LPAGGARPGRSPREEQKAKTVTSAPTTSIGGVSSTRPAGGVLPFTGHGSLPMLLAAAALLAGTRRRRRA